MLNNHVTSTVTLSRLNSTRCSPHLDGYTDWLVARRYTAATIELFLFGIIPLGQWLTQHDMPVSSFDHRALEAFRCDRDSIGQWRHTGGRRTVKAAFVGARRFHEYLVIKGHVESTPSASSLPKLLEDFAHWLQIHKGTRVVTVENHIYYLRKFVASLGDKPDAYDAIAVRGYLQTIAKRYPMPTTKATFGSVRVFLRYLVAAGLVTSSLPEAIPVIRDMRLASLPQYIVADDIKKLIDSCDCMPLTARRDRAVLLILARLALRASDVAMLNITDVDWRGARLRVGGKNRQQCWLPLPQDVGDALVDYIRHERPISEVPNLFMKSIAPVGPLNRQVVSSIVRRAIDRAGIDAPSCGAHLLRHSAATQMLAHGATLEQIGSILRHANINTTAIYAKVDTTLLEGVAAAWPEHNLSVETEPPKWEFVSGELS